MTAAWASLLRGACGAVLLCAAGAKAAGRVSVRPFLAASGIPPGLAGALDRAAWPLEAATGLLLLAGWFPLATAAVAAALAVGFAALQSVAAVRGMQEGCRCFGRLDWEDAPRSIAALRAAGLAVAALGLLALTLRRPSGSGTWAATAAGVAAGVAYVVAFALAGQVASFERRRPRRIRPRAVARGA